MAAPVFPVLGTASTAQAATVSRIVVNGNRRVDAETVRAYLQIQPGKNFGPSDVDQSLKTLFDTGLFSDVKINQSGGALVVSVVENPTINQIAFEGNKKYKDEQLNTVIESKPHAVFTQAKVQGDVQKILELYRRAGRFEGSVDPKIINLSENRVNLVFEINEGPKTGVSSINFIGNKIYGNAKLRSVISTRQSGILSFIRSSDVYDPDRLNQDSDKLRQFYTSHGYADFQVVSSVADLDRERNAFFITFTVDEGQRYRFGNIGVESTIPDVQTASLQRAIIPHQGDVYSSKDVQDSLEAITLKLAESGYAFAQVRPQIDRNPETKTIGVTFIVDEGARAYVQRIDIHGNTRTRDYVIRREFNISEGDAYNRILIDRAERKLKNLGYFKSVKVTSHPGDTADRVIVDVAVEEQPTGELSFGAGYSTSDGIIGDVSVSEKNFLGRGYLVKAGIGGGSSTRTYEFGFTDPYFLGRHISAGFDVFRREYDSNDYRSYDYKETGGNLTFGLPVTDNFTVQLGYQIEKQEISVDDSDCSDGNVSLAICQARGDAWISSVNYSLIYNTIDDIRDPHKGVYAKFTQEFAGVGGDVQFLRSTGQATYYRQLLEDADAVGFIKVQGGNITGLGDDVRLLDSFFKGGETIRGFESSGIGPRDHNTDDALGSKNFVAGTAEVDFPIPGLPRDLGFKAGLFVDAGTAWGTDADVASGDKIDDENTIRSSVGGSIIWASPLGPLRADFAYATTKADSDKTQVFRIGGGTQF
ncbi:outer membrane protein assembly factor BamA [Faunimonas pinastri]|uniref:outer membrane protein assembly factor BamA n=1 Tax=Faunimonas pinastri TaxID=1855383 RepID=UPI001EEB37D6|nr:outer membrane protein assembly factor BamA [Faunimonas pinastri]